MTIERKNLEERAYALIEATSDDKLLAFIQKYEKELNLPTLTASDDEQKMVLSFPDRTIIRCKWVNGQLFDNHCEGCALRNYCNSFHLNFKHVLCSCDIRRDEQSGHWEFIEQLKLL